MHTQLPHFFHDLDRKQYNEQNRRMSYKPLSVKEVSYIIEGSKSIAYFGRINESHPQAAESNFRLLPQRNHHNKQAHCYTRT